jgi:hypothetical protein
MKGYIYCVRSHQTTDVYYGSTEQKLSSRMSGHRSDYKCWINTKKNYVTSFEILKYGDAYIELVEECEYTSKQEMQKREGHFIREMECVNKIIAGRTRAEHYNDNAEEIKKYNIDNAEEIKKYYAKYCVDNATKIKDYHTKYNIENVEQIKEYCAKYRVENAEQIKETHAKYYVDNAPQIKAKSNEKHTCQCGGKYTYANTACHLKTKIHIKYTVSLCSSNPI